jgi:peptide/nickel transport system substrate-binding protein
LYLPLLSVLEANLTDPAFDQKIDTAIERNATHIWFNLAKPYAPFLKILCQPWCSILNKKFCVEHNDWPGTWDNWQDYYCNPEYEQHSPLDDPEPVMCGTGPYKFDYWFERDEWSVVKFDGYWGGWPANGCRGFVEKVTLNKIEDLSLTKTMFLDGQFDIAYVSKSSVNEISGQPGIRSVHPLLTFGWYGIFFTTNISLASPYLEPGVGYGEIIESGVPADFFSDVYVRKGFAYSFNYTEFLHVFSDWWAGIYPGTPVLEGMEFKNPAQVKYEFDSTKAEEHFKKAWNGQLWTEGFTLTIPYNVGNLVREAIIMMLKTNVESINPKFHIEPYAIKWGATYIPQLLAGQLPLFTIGWSAEYPDPHCLFHLFTHSKGLFPPCQRYSNMTVDNLIDDALHTLNETRRKEIYYKLQQIYFEECPSVVIFQTATHHWERTWVQGYYHNPAFPGLYFYHLWKEDLPIEDLNSDGAVNIIDMAVAAEAFASYYRVGFIHPRWNSRADLNMDQEVNILDIATIALKFGSR